MADPGDLEGTRLPPTVYEVGREEIREYLAAVGRPRNSASNVAPPTFAAVYALAPIGQLLADPAVVPHTARVIHVDQELSWSRPVRAGETLTTTGLVERVRRRGDAWFVTLSTSTQDESGAEVVRGRSTLLIGGAG